MQTEKHTQNLAIQSTDAASNQNQASITIDRLIDAQVAFVQQWLRDQAQPLTIEAWQWLGEQPLNKYLNADDLKHLINNWILAQPMSDVMRTDIRDIHCGAWSAARQMLQTSALMRRWRPYGRHIAMGPN